MCIKNIQSSKGDEGAGRHLYFLPFKGEMAGNLQERTD